MNLILLTKNDFVSETTARLMGRRYEHITEALKPRKGDLLAVGLLNAQMGTARVTVPPPPPLSERKFRRGHNKKGKKRTEICGTSGQKRTGSDGRNQICVEGTAADNRPGATWEGDEELVGEHPGYVELEILELRSAPPAKLPLTLVLALPRPKVLHRVLQAVSSLGVLRLVLIAAARVEPSYWCATKLSPEEVEQQLVLGLEQAGDTVVPQVALLDTWDAVVNQLADGDVVPGFAASTKLLAHPPDPDVNAEEGSGMRCPHGTPSFSSLVLAVGPEGGWVPHEITFLRSIGFRCVSLGDRVLRTETAIPVLIGRLF